MIHTLYFCGDNGITHLEIEYLGCRRICKHLRGLQQEILFHKSLLQILDHLSIKENFLIVFCDSAFSIDATAHYAPYEKVKGILMKRIDRLLAHI